MADSMSIAPTGETIAGADPALFVGKGLHIIGTMVGSMRDAHDVLQLAAAVRVSPHSQRPND
jgi:alcohol dehydrogenase, propanol-preferring